VFEGTRHRARADQVPAYLAAAVLPGSGVKVVDASQFLRAASADLVRRGTTARELLALEFDQDTGGMIVRMRATPLADRYPGLNELLEGVGRVCAADGITVRQLRGIVFQDDEISVRLVSDDGRGRIYTYPLQALDLGP
jgi:hypothetical protein